MCKSVFSFNVSQFIFLRIITCHIYLFVRVLNFYLCVTEIKIHLEPMKLKCSNGIKHLWVHVYMAYLSFQFMSTSALCKLFKEIFLCEQVLSLFSLLTYRLLLVIDTSRTHLPQGFNMPIFQVTPHKQVYWASKW